MAHEASHCFDHLEHRCAHVAGRKFPLVLGDEAGPENVRKSDLVLTDLVMEGMDGASLVQFIHTHKRYGHVRVIVLTGHGTVKTAVEAMQLGAFSFLEKPVDANMLRPLLQQALVEKGRTESGSTPETTPLIG